MSNLIQKHFNLNLSNTILGTLLLALTYLFFSIMELTAKELGQSFALTLSLLVPLLKKTNKLMQVVAYLELY